LTVLVKENKDPPTGLKQAVLNALMLRVGSEGFTLGSAKMLGTFEEVTDQDLDYMDLQMQSKDTFPTALYVLPEHCTFLLL
ncbi:13264_t:CDS:1, partial [Acaulospora colombiana]